MNKFQIALFLAGYIAVAAIPPIIAHRRNHHQRWAITVVSFVTFWCGTPIIPLLIWALWRIPLRIEINRTWYTLRKPDSLFQIFQRDHGAFVALASAYCAPAGTNSYHKNILVSLIDQNQLAWTKARFNEMAAQAKVLRTHALDQSQVNAVLCAAGERDLGSIIQSQF